MKRIPAAVTYTVLRLLTFIVPLAILLLLGFNEWFSAIVAALIGFAISLIFLRHPREQVAVAIHNKRTGADSDKPHETPTDEEAEDDVVEHSASAQHTDAHENHDDAHHSDDDVR
ncbi:DUF4229 domain-containing protein [Paramicrobacterium chengjingii]|uniref:DUF4229 domain-containing protein n=1 Tax=Paramicrobacterium chengjingii TaxID=2769067 RepID=A0ABX6YJM4_9MICO|nr:DUF4229 domain-containing protein [Microbacterium chengjingii]QPZ38830.1 DUF4229 domain-containing protein [Microbacterium chengjingii]